MAQSLRGLTYLEENQVWLELNDLLEVTGYKLYPQEKSNIEKLDIKVVLGPFKNFL